MVWITLLTTLASKQVLGVKISAAVFPFQLLGFSSREPGCDHLACQTLIFPKFLES